MRKIIFGGLVVFLLSGCSITLPFGEKKWRLAHNEVNNNWDDNRVSVVINGNSKEEK